MPLSFATIGHRFPRTRLNKILLSPMCNNAGGIYPHSTGTPRPRLHRTSLSTAETPAALEEMYVRSTFVASSLSTAHVLLSYQRFIITPCQSARGVGPELQQRSVCKFMLIGV